MIGCQIWSLTCGLFDILKGVYQFGSTIPLVVEMLCLYESIYDISYWIWKKVFNLKKYELFLIL